MHIHLKWKESILRAFPPPGCLRKQAAGLDLSDESIKVVDFVGQSQKLRLRTYGEEKIPLGVVQNGKIVKTDELVRSLESVREKHKLKYIVAALPEEEVYIVELSLPAMQKRELREAILLQLEELVPLKPNEVEFDYLILEEPTLEHPRFELKVLVLPKASVAAYSEVFERAHLVPLAFEIEGQALARALIPHGDPGALMIVDFGKWRTGIFIIVAEHLYFGATLPFGGSHLNKQIMDKFQVSESEAESMKRDRKDLAPAQSADFRALVRSVLTVLTDEINKYKLYWLSRENVDGDLHQKIDGIYLCGGGSNIEDMATILTEKVSLPMQLANPWINALSLKEHIPDLPAEDALRFATAIGLALRTKNFIPHS